MDKIVVIGGSGYIGGRLVSRLLRNGHSVRCLVRDPRKLQGRNWPGVEIVRGDILDPESLARALSGCDILYYLAHSIPAGINKFEETDINCAYFLKELAALSGIKRIIYLSSLGDRKKALTQYPRSRQKVGEILASGSVPVTEFRAGIILGSGSASFDMLHTLVNQFPIILLPKFVETRTQPISTRDTIRYLVNSLHVPESAGKVIDIGGPEILSYKEMILLLAEKLRLKRKVIVFPASIPRLYTIWINIATPIPLPIARMLIDGLQCEMIADSDLGKKLFQLDLMGFDESITRALRRTEEKLVETTWANASFKLETGQEPDNKYTTILEDARELEVNASPGEIFKVFSGIGGRQGWLFGNTLWRIRGFIDKMIGGVGLRRGRRHPSDLVPGDALDFWRVETVEQNRRIVLRAEMKAPGKAWLEFCVTPLTNSTSLLTQTARFYPHGLLGYVYWYSLVPFHAIIFARMARGIAKKAECGRINQKG